MTNTQTASLTALDTFRIKLITSSPGRLAILAAIAFSCILGGVLLLLTPSETAMRVRLPITLLASIPGGILYGLVLRGVYRCMQQAMNGFVGRQLTATDKTELFVWWRYGIKPETMHLQPVLPRYLDFLEKQLSVLGPEKPWFRRLAVVFFGSQVALNGWLIASGEASTANYFYIIMFAFFMLLELRATAPGTKALLRKLNYRQLRKIETLRRQL